jgi:ribonuclease HI
MPKETIKDLKHESEKDRIVIYADGSCLGNGKSNAAAGIGIFIRFVNGTELHVAAAFPLEKPTNQRAELFAIQYALREVPIHADIEIRTDSNYSIQCYTTWCKGWARNGWKNAKGKPVENQDIIRETLLLLTKRTGKTIWTHVYGHKGEEGNEIVDRLAVVGSTMFKKEGGNKTRRHSIISGNK